MVPSEIRGPDLAGVLHEAALAGLPNLVVGGFAVIAHGYLCATKDTDLLVSRGAETEEAILRFFERIGATRLIEGGVYGRAEIRGCEPLQVDSRHGAVAIHRGEAPLDFETASASAIEGVWRANRFRVVSLATLVALKRSSGRLGDELDLEKLAEVNGELPGDAMAGTDVD